MDNKLCFVAMPFDKKPLDATTTVDFDAIYRTLIEPSIRAAGLEPIRADEEKVGGIIHKPMFERLALCEFVVADLTTANANVFYELGVRHACRPRTTVLIFADKTRLPFDVALLRGLPYKLDATGALSHPDQDRDALTRRLKEIVEAASRVAAVADSPVYSLMPGYPQLSQADADAFREHVAKVQRTQAEIRAAVASSDAVALQAIEQRIGDVATCESAIVVALFLAYRDVKAWSAMISLFERMNHALAQGTQLREQYALALNRVERRADAEQVLLKLLNERGASSETYGILGRVYKDQWNAALKGGAKLTAPGLLQKAIDAYTKGFEADFRDHYPGINAVTLMEISDRPQPAREQLIHVVRYAASRKLAGGRADYWDQATRLELAVLARDQADAYAAAEAASALAPKAWQVETTVNNLKLIREARERRSEPCEWANQLEAELIQSVQPPAGPPPHA